MSVFVAEVARPTLVVRGLLGQAEPILITGGRAVVEYKESFVGIDVAKLKNGIAIAESGREGESRFWGLGRGIGCQHAPHHPADSRKV